MSTISAGQTIDPGATRPSEQVRITTSDGTMSSVSIAIGSAPGNCGAERPTP